MARIRLKVHRGASRKYNAWRAAIPGTEQDKQILLDEVYLPELAAQAVKLQHEAKQGAVWVAGPANTRFLVSFPPVERGSLEIMILDLLDHPDAAGQSPE